MTSLNFHPKGLSVKFALTITAVVAGVAFTIGAVIVTLDWQRFQRELEDKALLLAHSVAVTAPEDILQSDYWSLYKSLKNMANQAPGGKQDTRILTGMILDPDGVVLAHLNPNENPLGVTPAHSGELETGLFTSARKVLNPTILNGGIGKDGFLEGVVPIYSDEKLLGIVRVRLSNRELYLKAQRSAFIIIGLTFALVVLGSLMGALISRRITHPLTVMTEGMEAVSRGDFTNIVHVQVSDDDELGRLANTFNKMAVELSDKKALEEQMAVSEKLAALGRITAGVAHEVNTPLTGMMNCVDTLKKHPEDEKLLERYLPLLDKGLHRIRLIVKSLLVELRVEDATEISGPTCLDEVKELVDAEINGRDIHFIWENHLGDNIQISSNQTQQIVHNLLRNAVQVLPDGGTVAFRSFNDDKCVVFEVEDNGPGISPDHKKQLFDPFFTTRLNGTGLGLWIVYRLVESMRGIIDVESEVGRGTRFQVTLPTNETEA
ncbi:MAG: HAMP domain-containing protein [Rhodospirillaceae bacterium]|nr:HAMP domain-containing protein [Rhodospirillaceae bacterium]